MKEETNRQAPDAYIRRGNAYNHKGDYDRAIADLEQAVRLDPKDPKAYVIRGFAYVEKGDYDRAIADLEQAVRLDPKDPKAYVIRGFAYVEKGDYDRAIADLEQAIRLDPKDPEAYVVHGSPITAKAITTARSPITTKLFVLILIWRVPLKISGVPSSMNSMGSQEKCHSIHKS